MAMSLRFVKIAAVTAMVSALSQPAWSDEFSFAFEWGEIPLCQSGYPTQVPNPIFTLSNVPKGTAKIGFWMKDLNYIQYDHGGGNAAYNGEAVIHPGAFKYASPCPPNGSHTYEWTAYAKDANGDTLARASATRDYPK